MQNSLFHAQNNTDKSVVTDGDAYIGKSHGKLPYEEFYRTICPICQPVTMKEDERHISAVILVADLERRGVSLRAENGTVVCIGDSAVIDRFSRRIVEHKSPLLKLLDTPDVQPATRRDINSARKRLMPELSRLMCDQDALELAHKLDLLDQGFDIE